MQVLLPCTLLLLLYRYGIPIAWLLDGEVELYHRGSSAYRCRQRLLDLEA